MGDHERGDSSTPRASAIALIDQGNALQERGRTDEAMALYDDAVRLDPQCARAHLNRGNVLLAGARFEEARSAYQRALGCEPHYAAAHFNLGNLNCRVGEHEQALEDYRAAVAIKPDFAAAFVATGNVLDGLGRAAEAIENYERALGIDPNNPGIHFNLALSAASLGQTERAIDNLQRATDLQPDYAEAHHVTGRLLAGLGRFEAARTSLDRAAALAPESSDIARDRAMVLLTLGRFAEALNEATRNLELAQTWQDKVAFARCVSPAKLARNDVRVRAALRAALTEPWGTPYQLVSPALSLVILDPVIAACVARTDEQRPARVPGTPLFDGRELGALAADHLLHAVLETAPVTTPQFERLLTAARQALLESAAGRQSADAALPFYAALARQCFVNEYIFDCTESEGAAAAGARADLLALLDAGAPVPPLLLLAVAAYYPLYTLPEPTRLLAGSQPGPIAGVLRQQIGEPLEEQALRSSIRSLTSISYGVSQKVRDQYEENPYPRWVKFPIHGPALRLNGELRRVLPFARFTPMADDSQPQVLIAGCGTGSHPILMAQRCHGVRVLAVDLSLSSISYALRKTQEFSITNVEYAQADILGLGSLDRRFDVVAAVGVLHHLEDPFAGWRILLGLLRPGGFMHLGFYSQVARRHVVRAREFIAARGWGSSAADVRRFRREYAASGAGPEIEWLRRSPDFYSTSECRDLLFHVQEHRLTLGEIHGFLAEAGLQFLGFELDPRVMYEYRSRFSDDPCAVDLDKWARFEADNPDTFAGMYQFWVQKPG